jgi:hypothetical protein
VGQPRKQACRPRLLRLADDPYNWLPYMFAGYMLIGLGWFGFLWRRAPDALVIIEHDMEEA